MNPKKKRVTLNGVSAGWCWCKPNNKFIAKRALEEIACNNSRAIGMDLEIKYIKLDGLLRALKSQNIDMIVSGMKPIEERRKSVNFTDVYYNGEIYVN